MQLVLDQLNYKEDKTERAYLSEDLLETPGELGELEMPGEEGP